MEENIMTTTEELVEATEDICLDMPGKNIGVGLAVGAGLVGLGAIIYKVGKKLKAKHKAKKAAKAEAKAEAVSENVDYESVESDEE